MVTWFLMYNTKTYHCHCSLTPLAKTINYPDKLEMIANVACLDWHHAACHLIFDFDFESCHLCFHHEKSANLLPNRRHTIADLHFYIMPQVLDKKRPCLFLF